MSDSMSLPAMSIRIVNHLAYRSAWGSDSDMAVDSRQTKIDDDKCKQLKRFIRSSPSTVLPAIHARCLKIMSTSSDLHVHRAVHHLVDHLFTRSKDWRDTIVEMLSEYVKKAEGRLVAKNKTVMAELVKKSLRDWNAQFGKAYPKLSIAVQCYAKPESNASVYPSASTTIPQVVSSNTTSQMVLRVWQDQINAVVEGSRSCCTEIQNGVTLLTKSSIFTDFDSNAASTSGANLELHGISVGSHDIVLDRPTYTVAVNELPDVSQALTDARNEVVRQLLPKTTMLLTKLVGIAQDDNVQQTKDRLLDCRAQLIAAIQQVTEVVGHHEFGHLVDSDDDFISVRDDDVNQPSCSSSSTVKRIHRKLKIKKDADEQTGEKPSLIPILPYGLDLKYWGESKTRAPDVARNNEDDHRFWRPRDNDDREQSSSNMYTARAFTHTSKATKIDRVCGAKINENGGVCLRMDRKRCPFHGEITDGIRIDDLTPEQTTIIIERSPAENSKTESKNAWQDVAVMSELEKTTGQKINYGCNGEKKKSKMTRSKRRRSPTEAQQQRKRLSTKILSKSSIRRIGETLDETRRQRNETKFGHQFNYALRK